MADAELIALGESLQDQVVTVNRLRADLEEERRAAASGVEEALSMIMRLQVEKAAQKMEACQYKRMAEEKMHHAEESIAILNEEIYQKEFEIASLKYHLQNYKQKLLIVDDKDFDFESVKPNGNPWLKKGITFARNESLNRNISLPAIRLQELLSDIDTTDKYCSLIPDRQLTPSEDVVCQKDIMEERNIKKIDVESNDIMEEYDTKEVHNFFKEFRSRPINAGRRSKRSIAEFMSLEDERDYSWHPDGDIFEKSTFLTKTNEENVICGHSQDKNSENGAKFTLLHSSIAQTNSDGNSVNIIDVQDIYEIQDNKNSDGCCGINSEMPRVTISGAKCIKREPDPLQNQEMSFKSYICANYENNLSKQHQDIFLTNQEYMTTVVPCKTDIEQLKERMQRLEDYVKNINQEDQARKKEQTELLTRVVEQLDMIRTHFEKPKTKFDYNQDNEFLMHLVEAMSCFWL